jgi:steroid delta-isomerase
MMKGMGMTRDEMQAFVAGWTAAWNELAVERVLAHFDEKVSFTSPTARAVVGVGTVVGKQALRAYWSKAVAQVGSLRFVVDRIMWDPGAKELAIVYLSEIDGRKKRVSEHLTFDSNGLVVTAEVFHGVDA